MRALPPFAAAQARKHRELERLIRPERKKRRVKKRKNVTRAGEKPRWC